MISIDLQFIQTAAPNAEAAKNGLALVVKGKFKTLRVTPDETLLFGFCQGSGKEPYLCSADFAVPEKPVYRCSCPSRQFPCKHSLGLLHAKAQGKTFATEEAPAELSAKREKAAARVEKKKEVSEKPPKVNLSALAKKLKAQLAGIDVLENLTHEVTRLGIGNMNAKVAREMEEQAKRLGDAFLPGAQTALRRFTTLFSTDTEGKPTAAQREAVFSEALDQLGRLHSLIGKGRAYLQKRLEDPALEPETDSSIAAWLGHAWRLDELKAAGLVEEKVELVQLAFESYDDPARKEFVDAGVWMHLGNGRVSVTQTLRPYKAVKHVKCDDSFHQVAQVPELCVYPGDMNPRVRWDAMTARPLQPKDLVQIRALARSEFGAAIKDVKSNLKTPLADKRPIVALRYRRLGAVGKSFAIEDSAGERLVLSEVGAVDEPRGLHPFRYLPKEMEFDQTLVARFRHDLDSRKLTIEPLSIVTSSEILRLTV